MANESRSGLLKWGGGLVVILAAAAGVYYWQHPAKTATEYRTAPVERGDVVQMVTATGQLNPVVNVQVGSQISGIITNLAADFNSKVKKDQIVAQLDSATYEANLHQAEGDLASAKAALELSQLAAKRSSALRTDNLIPFADDEKAQADLHQAEAMVKIKQASVEKAKVDLARCTIYAPVDGVVISRNVDVGQTVAASLSAPTIFVIANDLSKMQIDANVSEADVGGVEVGQKVNFSVDAFPYRTFHGEVVQIRNAPITNQNVITYDTVISVKNDDLKLKPGMTANVSIIVAEKADALKIPNAALRFRPLELAKKGATNTPSASSASSTNRQMADGGRQGGGGRRERPSGAGGGERGSGGERGGSPRQLARTIYTPVTTNEVVEPKPVQIKTGISDGVYTEVVEGLTEDDKVIIGIMVDNSASTQAAPQAGPFGGPMRRF